MANGTRIWDTVRYLVDESDEDGLYVLTGFNNSG